MKFLPKISVIVPVYNVEKYLSRCIDSILAQTFMDFELILIDDGSSDNCGKICDEYAEKDGRIKVIHKRNGGVSQSRNCGLELSTGDYIAFVDSDDYIKEDCFEVLYHNMVDYGYDCVSIGFSIVDSNYQEKKTILHNPVEYLLNNEEEIIDHITNYVLLGKTGWEIWARLFRADIIKKNNLIMCETCANYAEDLGFYLAYLLYCKRIRNLNYVGYYYYLRDNSMMRSSKNNVKLNAMNEVSKCYYQYIIKYNNGFACFPLIHSLLIWIELQKVVEIQNYDMLPTYCKEISDMKWYRNNIAVVVKNKKMLLKVFDKKQVEIIRNLFFFTLHKNLFFFLLIKRLKNI